VVPKARLEQQEAGLTPVSDGWFVVNVPDAAWVTNPKLGDACVFEGDEVSFRDLGYTIAVFQPGQSGGRYHREANQENFLVLAGECVLVIEGEERRLKRWDFVHCPPNTEHGFVGAGDGPCVIFMVGSRQGWPEKGIVYPLSELALRHGVGVEQETTVPPEAYAPFPKWLPGRPRSWAGLPWE
jgi:quercetin dioxygenase-like cupin family protein